MTKSKCTICPQLVSLFIFFFMTTVSFALDISGNHKFTSNLNLLESWIGAQMEYRRLPGLAIGIVYDGDLIYGKGFGYADLEKQTPMTTGSIFRIASITKTFTATAIMQLRDRGKLSLDDPVEKHLKWFKMKNNDPDSPTIRIWHLLTHTSGLPRESAFPYWTDYRFPSRRQMIEALADQETIYPPEEKLKYSNLALAIAGEIVSRVSGMPYDKYISEYILKPLGMSSTFVLSEDIDRTRLVTPYSQILPDGGRRIRPFTDCRGLSPAANMSSTVEDLAKFVSAQFGSGSNKVWTVLKSSSLREMQRVHWLRPNWKGGWGIGFSVWRENDLTLVGHGGWVAGNRSQIVFIPEKKIGVIVLANSDDGEPYFFAKKILGLMTPIIDEIVSPHEIPPPVAEELERYVGRFTDTWFYDTEFMIVDGGLVMNGYGVPPEENPGDALIELSPVSEHVFRMTGDNGDGELVTFIFNRTGEIDSVKVGENYLYPKR